MEDAVEKESCRAVCPIGDCQFQLDHSELLGHLIRAHLNEMPQSPSPTLGLRMRKVQTGERTLLLMAHKQLIAGQDHCLCVLNWSGNESYRNMLPIQSNLPCYYRYLTNRLPVLVMVCKTSLPALLYNTEQRDVDMQEKGCLYIFWLVAPATRRPINARLSFFNRHMSCGMCLRRQVLSLGSRMSINEFLLNNDQFYLTLNEWQVDQMCSPNANCSFLEVVIVGDGF